MGASEFRFFLSCDLNSPVTFRIEKLDGTLPLEKSTDSGTQKIQSICLLLVEVDFNRICSILIDVNVINNCLVNGVEFKVSC